MPRWANVFLAPDEMAENERKRLAAIRKQSRHDQPVLVRIGGNQILHDVAGEIWLSVDVLHGWHGARGSLRMPVTGYSPYWFRAGCDALVLDGYIEWDEPELPKTFIGIMGDRMFLPYGRSESRGYD